MLFSTAMVQALLDGTKTQTRRISKTPVPKHKITDIIWVREIYAETCDQYGTPIIAYKVGKPRLLTVNRGKYELWKETNTNWHIDNYPSCGKWLNSMFMPKYACRLFLQITDMKIEPLQNINGKDAIDEGVDSVDSYKTLWQKINGAGSWGQNPLVWVYTFKQVERPADF